MSPSQRRISERDNEPHNRYTAHASCIAEDVYTITDALSRGNRAGTGMGRGVRRPDSTRRGRTAFLKQGVGDPGGGVVLPEQAADVRVPLADLVAGGACEQAVHFAHHVLG